MNTNDIFLDDPRLRPGGFRVTEGPGADQLLRAPPHPQQEGRGPRQEQTEGFVGILGGYLVMART